MNNLDVNYLLNNHVLEVILKIFKAASGEPRTFQVHQEIIHVIYQHLSDQVKSMSGRTLRILYKGSMFDVPDNQIKVSIINTNTEMLVFFNNERVAQNNITLLIDI